MKFLNINSYLRSDNLKVIIFFAFFVFSFVIGVVVYLFPHDRSIVLSVRTRGVSISFLGGQTNIWPLQSVVVCVRKDRIDRLAAEQKGAFCDPKAFVQVALERAELFWPDGVAAKISRVSSDGGLKILIQSYRGEKPRIGSYSLGVGSVVWVSVDFWNLGQVLTYSGKVKIGDTPAPGASDILEYGQFEMREISNLQNRAPVVTSGSFQRGDSVMLLGGVGEDLSAFGFVSVSENSSPGFDFTAYTPMANASIQMTRLGAEPISISPTWLDRASNDVYLTAAAAIVGVIAALFGIIGIWLDFYRHANER